MVGNVTRTNQTGSKGDDIPSDCKEQQPLDLLPIKNLTVRTAAGILVSSVVGIIIQRDDEIKAKKFRRRDEKRIGIDRQKREGRKRF